MNVKYTDILLTPHISVFLCCDFFIPFFHFQSGHEQIIFVQNKNILLAEVNGLVILKMQCGNILMFQLKL